MQLHMYAMGEPPIRDFIGKHVDIAETSMSMGSGWNAGPEQKDAPANAWAWPHGPDPTDDRCGGSNQNHS